MMSLSWLVCGLLLLVACGDDAAPAADGGTSPDATAGADASRSDASTPPYDAGAADGAICQVECAAPPPGCRYEGPVSCDPPSCGTLVCDDAGTAAVMCTASGTGGSFPEPDRSCGEASDCTVVLHQTDCCGNQAALGIAASAGAAFDEAEASCRAMYPTCRCPAGPTTDDDGDPVLDIDAIDVECRAGACHSFVP